MLDDEVRVDEVEARLLEGELLGVCDDELVEERVLAARVPRPGPHRRAGRCGRGRSEAASCGRNRRRARTRRTRAPRRAGAARPRRDPSSTWRLYACFRTCDGLRHGPREVWSCPSVALSARYRWRRERRPADDPHRSSSKGSWSASRTCLARRSLKEDLLRTGHRVRRVRAQRQPRRRGEAEVVLHLLVRPEAARGARRGARGAGRRRSSR